jgi:hypothetical protein
MKLLFAALLLGAAPPALAQANAAAPAATAPSAEADRLAGTLLGDTAMQRLGKRAFDTGMEQQIAANAELRKLFAEQPSAKAELSQKLYAEFTRMLAAELPVLRARLSGIIAADMTPGEIGDTLAFFQSPVGQKIMTQVYETLGDNPVQSQEQAQQAAMTAVMASLQPEDYPALLAFGGTTAASKMQTVNPKIAAASKQWAAEMVAKNQGRIQAIAAGAAAKYRKGKK